MFLVSGWEEEEVSGFMFLVSGWEEEEVSGFMFLVGKKKRILVSQARSCGFKLDAFVLTCFQIV
jgi:hypothetical protein